MTQTPEENSSDGRFGLQFQDSCLFRISDFGFRTSPGAPLGGEPLAVEPGH